MLRLRGRGGGGALDLGVGHVTRPAVVGEHSAVLLHAQRGAGQLAPGVFHGQRLPERAGNDKTVRDMQRDRKSTAFIYLLF